MQFTVESAYDNQLLRTFLQQKGVSAALLARLKRKAGGILQNGVSVTVRAVLHTGDCITLALEDAEGETSVVPRDFPICILQRTADFTVVNKSADMPTHPSHGHFEDTLANALAFHLSTAEIAFRPRFINRLDRNTTGIVLVANHALAASTLSRAMARGEIQKGYLALVHGALSAPQRVETGIRRREESIILREVCALSEGELAITDVEPLASSAAFSLVRLTPHTGRTHQLRVHMAHLGHPLLGDDLYGVPDGFSRHALHAVSLDFPDPQSGARVHVEAPVPEDMREKIFSLGKEAIALVKG